MLSNFVLLGGGHRIVLQVNKQNGYIVKFVVITLTLYCLSDQIKNPLLSNFVNAVE